MTLKTGDRFFRTTILGPVFWRVIVRALKPTAEEYETDFVCSDIDRIRWLTERTGMRTLFEVSAVLKSETVGVRIRKQA